MYHCGPTVYDHVHIGNLRSAFFADILRRSFEYIGYEVDQVMNVTDLGNLLGDGADEEDKMTKGLLREGKPLTLHAMKDLGEFYTERFKEDLNKLNIHIPKRLVRASDHIPEQIDLIKLLEDKGFVYVISDGVYFNTQKDKNYGKLLGVGKVKDLQSRIEENSEKKDPKDFALWKFNNEKGFESPWGKGFPGWHIECSAMSAKYLGEHFDIHSGGIDLAPIHHNNEIAQSENAHGHQFVNYWLHNEFINVDDEKMAKSKGNFIVLKTIEEEGYSPLSYRYFLLLSHYRTKTNFTWEGLMAAQNALTRLERLLEALPKGGKVDELYKIKFVEKIENDFNTPQALALVWTLLKDENVSPANKHATIMDFDRILGLRLG